MKMAQRTSGLVPALAGASIDLDVPPIEDLDDTHNWNLTGTAWSVRMTYQNLTIPVYLPISDGEGELSVSETKKRFRVAYAANASPWVDLVTVRPVDDDWTVSRAPTETASSGSRARVGARGPDQYLIDAADVDGTNGSTDAYRAIYRERTLSTTAPSRRPSPTGKRWGRTTPVCRTRRPERPLPVRLGRVRSAGCDHRRRVHPPSRPGR
jgi:hypothetical protein